MHWLQDGQFKVFREPIMRWEKYRGEFVDISLLEYIKKIWLRPAFHVNCQHAGQHPYTQGFSPDYPVNTPEMRPHTVVDMRTGYWKFVAGYERIEDAKRHCLILMLTRLSWIL